jgi:hypothetical protein
MDGCGVDGCHHRGTGMRRRKMLIVEKFIRIKWVEEVAFLNPYP